LRLFPSREWPNWYCHFLDQSWLMRRADTFSVSYLLSPCLCETNDKCIQSASEVSSLRVESVPIFELRRATVRSAKIFGLEMLCRVRRNNQQSKSRSVNGKPWHRNCSRIHRVRISSSSVKLRLSSRWFVRLSGRQIESCCHLKQIGCCQIGHTLFSGNLSHSTMIRSCSQGKCIELSIHSISCPLCAT
jgi:hypothetical protein